MPYHHGIDQNGTLRSHSGKVKTRRTMRAMQNGKRQIPFLLPEGPLVRGEVPERA
jgi:hypothetical protein